MTENKLPNRFYLYLFIVAFAVNWIWEVSQTFAFDMNGVSTGKMLLFCTFASVIDGIVTVLIFWLLRKFIEELGWKFFLAAAVLGALTAVFFEQTAFNFNLWSYDEEMPVIPVIGTGLLPLVQLTLLVPLAIFISKKLWFSKNNKLGE